MNKLRTRLALSLALAKAEFIERNEGSYLGIFWYLLNPIFLFLLLLLVFFDRVGSEIASYPLYLLIGIIMFNFFQQATVDSTKAMREARWLIKSINFPREALINAVVLKALFSHMFEIFLFIIVLLFFKGPVNGLIFYPVILIFFFAFVFGISLILSSFAVYFTDIENVWAFASRLIWLGTPIFYAIGGQTRLAFVSLFNPMYYFVTISRDVIVYAKAPQAWMAWGLIGYSLFFLIIGLLFFKILKNKFAELL